MTISQPTEAWILICSLLVITSTVASRNVHWIPSGIVQKTPWFRNVQITPAVPFPQQKESKPTTEISCISSDPNIYQIIEEVKDHCKGNDCIVKFYHQKDRRYRKLGTCVTDKHLFQNILMKYSNWILSGDKIDENVPNQLPENRNYHPLKPVTLLFDEHDQITQWPESNFHTENANGDSGQGSDKIFDSAHQVLEESNTSNDSHDNGDTDDDFQESIDGNYKSSYNPKLQSYEVFLPGYKGSQTSANVINIHLNDEAENSQHIVEVNQIEDTSGHYDSVGDLKTEIIDLLLNNSDGILYNELDNPISHKLSKKAGTSYPNIITTDIMPDEEDDNTYIHDIEVVDDNDVENDNDDLIFSSYDDHLNIDENAHIITPSDITYIDNTTPIPLIDATHTEESTEVNFDKGFDDQSFYIDVPTTKETSISSPILQTEESFQITNALPNIEHFSSSSVADQHLQVSDTKYEVTTSNVEPSSGFELPTDVPTSKFAPQFSISSSTFVNPNIDDSSKYFELNTPEYLSTSNIFPNLDIHLKHQDIPIGTKTPQYMTYLQDSPQPLIENVLPLRNTHSTSMPASVTPNSYIPYLRAVKVPFISPLQKAPIQYITPLKYGAQTPPSVYGQTISNPMLEITPSISKELIDYPLPISTTKVSNNVPDSHAFTISIPSYSNKYLAYLQSQGINIVDDKALESNAPMSSISSNPQYPLNINQAKPSSIESTPVFESTAYDSAAPSIMSSAEETPLELQQPPLSTLSPFTSTYLNKTGFTSLPPVSYTSTWTNANLLKPMLPHLRHFGKYSFQPRPPPVLSKFSYSTSSLDQSKVQFTPILNLLPMLSSESELHSFLNMNPYSAIGYQTEPALISTKSDKQLKNILPLKSEVQPHNYVETVNVESTPILSTLPLFPSESELYSFLNMVPYSTVSHRPLKSHPTSPNVNELSFSSPIWSGSRTPYDSPIRYSYQPSSAISFSPSYLHSSSVPIPVPSAASTLPLLQNPYVEFSSPISYSNPLSYFSSPLVNKAVLQPSSNIKYFEGNYQPFSPLVAPISSKAGSISGTPVLPEMAYTSPISVRSPTPMEEIVQPTTLFLSPVSPMLSPLYPVTSFESNITLVEDTNLLLQNESIIENIPTAPVKSSQYSMEPLYITPLSTDHILPAKSLPSPIQYIEQPPTLSSTQLPTVSEVLQPVSYSQMSENFRDSIPETNILQKVSTSSTSPANMVSNIYPESGDIVQSNFQPQKKYNFISLSSPEPIKSKPMRFIGMVPDTADIQTITPMLSRPVSTRYGTPITQYLPSAHLNNGYLNQNLSPQVTPFRHGTSPSVQSKDTPILVSQLQPSLLPTQLNLASYLSPTLRPLFSTSPLISTLNKLTTQPNPIISPLQPVETIQVPYASQISSKRFIQNFSHAPQGISMISSAPIISSLQPKEDNKIPTISPLSQRPLIEISRDTTWSSSSAIVSPLQPSEVNKIAAIPPKPPTPELNQFTPYTPMIITSPLQSGVSTSHISSITESISKDGLLHKPMAITSPLQPSESIKIALMSKSSQRNPFIDVGSQSASIANIISPLQPSEKPTIPLISSMPAPCSLIPIISPLQPSDKNKISFLSTLSPTPSMKAEMPQKASSFAMAPIISPLQPTETNKILLLPEAPVNPFANSKSFSSSSVVSRTIISALQPSEKNKISAMPPILPISHISDLNSQVTSPTVPKLIKSPLQPSETSRVTLMSEISPLTHVEPQSSITYSPMSIISPLSSESTLIRNISPKNPLVGISPSSTPPIISPLQPSEKIRTPLISTRAPLPSAPLYSPMPIISPLQPCEKDKIPEIPTIHVGTLANLKSQPVYSPSLIISALQPLEADKLPLMSSVSTVGQKSRDESEYSPIPIISPLQPDELDKRSITPAPSSKTQRFLAYSSPPIISPLQPTEKINIPVIPAISPAVSSTIISPLQPCERHRISLTSPTKPVLPVTGPVPIVSPLQPSEVDKISLQPGCLPINSFRDIKLNSPTTYSSPVIMSPLQPSEKDKISLTPTAMSPISAPPRVSPTLEPIISPLQPSDKDKIPPISLVASMRPSNLKSQATSPTPIISPLQPSETNKILQLSSTLSVTPCKHLKSQNTSPLSPPTIISPLQPSETIKITLKPSIPRYSTPPIISALQPNEKEMIPLIPVMPSRNSKSKGMAQNSPAPIISPLQPSDKNLISLKATRPPVNTLNHFKSQRVCTYSSPLIISPLQPSDKNKTPSISQKAFMQPNSPKTTPYSSPPIISPFQPSEINNLAQIPSMSKLGLKAQRGPSFSSPLIISPLQPTEKNRLPLTPQLSPMSPYTILKPKSYSPYSPVAIISPLQPPEKIKISMTPLMSPISDLKPQRVTPYSPPIIVFPLQPFTPQYSRPPIVSPLQPSETRNLPISLPTSSFKPITPLKSKDSTYAPIISPLQPHVKHKVPLLIPATPMNTIRNLKPDIVSPIPLVSALQPAETALNQPVKIVSKPTMPLTPLIVSALQPAETALNRPIKIVSKPTMPLAPLLVSALQPTETALNPPIKIVSKPTMPLAPLLVSALQPTETALNPSIKIVAKPIMPLAPLLVSALQPTETALNPPIKVVAKPIMPLAPLLVSALQPTETALNPPIKIVSKPTMPSAPLIVSTLQPAETPLNRPIKIVSKPTIPSAPLIVSALQPAETALNSPIKIVPKPTMPLAPLLVSALQPTETALNPPIKIVSKPTMPLAPLLVSALQPAETALNRPKKIVSKPTMPSAPLIVSALQPAATALNRPIKIVSKPTMPSAPLIVSALQPAATALNRPIKIVSKPTMPSAPLIVSALQPAETALNRPIKIVSKPTIPSAPLIVSPLQPAERHKMAFMPKHSPVSPQPVYATQYMTPINSISPIATPQFSPFVHEYMNSYSPQTQNIPLQNNLQDNLLQYITNNKDIITKLSNSNTDLDIPIGNFIIAKKSCINSTAQAINSAIGLKIWPSDLKLVEAKLVLKCKDITSTNFVPVVNGISQYNSKEIENIVANHIRSNYGDVIIVNDSYSLNNEYEVIMGNINSGNKINLLWPSNTCTCAITY